MAGRFYPGDAAVLDAEVTRLLATWAAPRPRLAVMAPHAGYVYSGPIAGRNFAATAVPRRVIVLAPNHTGRGARAAVWARGALALPGDAVPVDEALADAVVGQAGLVADREAHRFEHALEVELPFLRAQCPSVTVLPIILGPLDLAGCEAIAGALARATEHLAADEVLLVASSDMNHYLDDATTRRLDERALEPLLALDAAALHARVLDEDLSMCGVVPATVMALWAKARGATRAELVAYGTSGDAFGDRDRVVGYAGVAID